MSPRLGFWELAEWDSPTGSWGPEQALWERGPSRGRGHADTAGLAKGQFPIQDSLEVKVSRRRGGQISRSEHVTELTPLVGFGFPPHPSPRTLGDVSPMTGRGLGGYGGRSCCQRMRLESDTGYPCGQDSGPGPHASEGRRGDGGRAQRECAECAAAAHARSEWAVWPGPRASLTATPAAP